MGDRFAACRFMRGGVPAVIAQQIVNGFVVGGVYALFALGFTLIFGIHRILNLAQGGVLMAGAFIGLYATLAGLPLWLAVLLAIVGCGLLSVLIEIVAFRLLRRTGEQEFGAIISSIGANLIIVHIGQQVSQTRVQRFPFGTFPVQFFQAFGLRVSLLQLFMLGFSVVLVGLLSLYLYRTSWGRQVRAVAGDERTSRLLGIDPRLIFFQTFFISGALAGAAGVLVGLAFNSIHFLMGEPFLLRAFVVIVLGGLGSVPGALIAGLLLGMIQTLGTAYIPSGLVDTLVFSLLFLILLVRPNGLLGHGAPEGLGRRR